MGSGGVAVKSEEMRGERGMGGDWGGGQDGGPLFWPQGRCAWAIPSSAK